ncbi:MAG: response regulator [Acidobacteriales bacterium]|nr:response regulator [Terriglobales bacterium]
MSHLSVARLDAVEDSTEEWTSGSLSHSQAILTPSEMFAYMDRSPTVLIVDSQEVNRRVMRGMLKQEPYHIFEAGQAQEAISILERERVDLVILDLMMPGISGLELCRRIKSSRRTQLLPVLMLTSVQGIESEVAGLASGADEFLNRPLHPTVVRTRIRAMLRNKAAVDSLEEAETILFALAQAVEQRDPYTDGHCERLSRYAVELGNALGLPRPQLLALHRGGFLHDIGKISVPDSILFKKSRLNEEEWTLMRSHTVRGEAICRPMKNLAPVLPIIRNHHERWDGSGYPDQLRGEGIPLLARILQIADIYDALTTERPYKVALSTHEALEILGAETRCGWRDPELTALFAELIERGIFQHTMPTAADEELRKMETSLLQMGRNLIE